MYVKIFALFGLVTVASAADLIFGVDGGRIIYEQNVTASPAIWKQTKNVTVNASKSDEVISRVVVTDNRLEKDGEAKVVEGGEGEKNVTIELQSPAVFRGFDFSIQVFATQEDVYARAPNHPKTTGVDKQNPQVPDSKDVNVKDNSNQGPKNGDDIILGAPTPTATSTTETNKDGDKIINPALVGKEQTRLNRDTEGQKEQTPPPTPVDVSSGVDATKDIKVNENANKTVQADLDDDLKKALDSIFENNSSQKTEDSPKGQAPVMPQADDKDDEDDEENRKVRQVNKEPIVPALPKELKNDEDHTTPKSDISSTTAKNIGQENFVPRVLPIGSEVSTTSSADKITTESSKLPENVKTTQGLERNLKGHHFGHHHSVPLPYVN